MGNGFVHNKMIISDSSVITNAKKNWPDPDLQQEHSQTSLSSLCDG